MSGDPGSGAGRGGGGGGAIRSAGGGFGKMEAAREEEYFYKKVCLVDKIKRKIIAWKFANFYQTKEQLEQLNSVRNELHKNNSKKDNSLIEKNKDKKK